MQIIIINKKLEFKFYNLNNFMKLMNSSINLVTIKYIIIIMFKIKFNSYLYFITL